ncbi:MAG: ABC transporter permease [Dehalococcoidia bacterium]|nr:ABC transporter permease [Dehalococcoidia bacterium]
MRGIVRIWRLFSRRSGRNWRLLAVLALGMIMAASLLAAAPVYARTMADLGLTFLVREDLNDSPGNRVQFTAIPLATEEGTELKRAVASRIEERLGWFEASSSRYLRTGRFFTGREGAEITWLSPQGQLQSLTGYEERVRLLEGNFPKSTPAGEAIEVALGPQAAAQAKLAVGQTFRMVEDFDDCARELPSLERPPPPPCTPVAGVTFGFTAKLTGIIEPISEDDAFWVTLTSIYFAPFSVGTQAGVVVPMFTTEETLLGNFAAHNPGYMAETAWHTYADPERLSKSNFERAREDLIGLHGDVEALGGASFSPLSNLLDVYRESASYQQAPLTILLLEVAAVALFYVILMALVIVERQADEISLLRSRGATTYQVGAMYLLEGLILGIPCLLAAPFIAAVSTSALGLTPTFEKVNGGELLPTTIPLSAFAFAAIGVGLSVVVLLVPAILVARRSAVARRREQARPGASFLQRYYLDLALAGVAGLLLWELQEKGTVFQPSATGGVSSDPLLLASPAILMLAAAALLLRFYPMALRLGARLFGRKASPAVAVGLWQVARSPGNSARLALLLTMAVAVGTFAASYSTTAKATFDDRAKYAAGVEWRMAGGLTSSMGLNGKGNDARLSALPGVDYATAVIRIPGSPAIAGVSARSFQVLGVDPDRASEMLWFRDDFADLSLREMMANLGAPQPLRGKALPAGTTSLKIKVSSSDQRAVQTLWARVVDKDQSFQMLELGTMPGPGWHEMSVNLQKNPDGVYGEPFFLMSLMVTEPSNRFNAQNLVILIDDITAVGAGGQETLLEGFEGTAPGWTPLPSKLAKQDVFEITRDGAATGNSAGKLTRLAGQSTDLWGLYYTQSTVPMPVIASESFSASTGIPPGGAGNVVVGDILTPITITATFRLMPTLDTSQGPAVIFNRDHLLSWIGIVDVIQAPGINEAWFALEPGADVEALERALSEAPFSLEEMYDQQSQLESLERNPLIAAGGAGILYIAFGAVLLLVAAALLVSLWVSVQRRRGEFAVLRAMGLSRGQVVQLLAFEYAIVAILGLVAGAYLGRLVGERMLSFLNVDDAGNRAEPGFLLETDWLLVIAGGAIVLAVFIAAMVFAGRLITRTSDAAALRTE